MYWLNSFSHHVFGFLWEFNENNESEEKDCLDQGKKNWKKQASEKESTDHDEAKQQQKKEQHQSPGKHQSLGDAELYDSDNEYLTNSEHEEGMHLACKQPRESCGTSAPGSSQLTNSHCTWQTPPSPNNHIQQRQSPRTKLLSSSTPVIHPHILSTFVILHFILHCHLLFLIIHLHLLLELLLFHHHLPALNKDHLLSTVAIQLHPALIVGQLL